VSEESPQTADRSPQGDASVAAPAPDTQDPAPDTQVPAPDTQVPAPDTQVPAPDTRHPTPEPEPEPEPVEDIPDPGEDLALHLLDVKVRLWAELGRARLPLAHAVGLGSGAIVDLDKGPDEQLEILVNGRPFAKGTLLLEDGEWAVRLEEIVATPQALEQASSSGSGA
jgi:flagellar motor switch protein FliN